MFISNLGSPERRRNHSLTSKCIFKNPKLHELPYVLKLKTHGSCVLFPLFLADLDKQYRNEIEVDKNSSVREMEYIYFQIIVSRKDRKSLSNLQVQIQKP